jgi:hypothetical protein
VKKWPKRLAIVTTCLLVGLCLVSGGLYLMFHRTPDWYALPQRTQAERDAAAHVAEQKLTQTQQFFEAAHAREVQRRYAERHNSTSPTANSPATSQPAAITVSFTQDELNAFFAKWAAVNAWRERYDDYISDPAIILHDGRVILAARVKEMDTVVSMHVEPMLDPAGDANARGGGLHLEIVKILGGNLRLPEAVIDKPRTKLIDAMRAALPDLQHDARIDANGAANREAVCAGMIKLALNVLRHEPGEPVLFLPLISKENHSVPVRLTAVRVENQTLTLTVEPLGPTDRAALLDRIREPWAVAASARPRARERDGAIN